MTYGGLVVGDVIEGEQGSSTNSTSLTSQRPDQRTARNLNYYYVDDTGRTNLIGLDEDRGGRDYYPSEPYPWKSRSNCFHWHVPSKMTYQGLVIGNLLKEGEQGGSSTSPTSHTPTNTQLAIRICRWQWEYFNLTEDSTLYSPNLFLKSWIPVYTTWKSLSFHGPLIST